MHACVLSIDRNSHEEEKKVWELDLNQTFWLPERAYEAYFRVMITCNNLGSGGENYFDIIPTAGYR